MTGQPEQAAPKGSRSLILTVAVALITFTAWIALSSGRGPVDILSVSVQADQLLSLAVDSCNGNPEITRLEVDQATGLVFVAVTSNTNSNEECLDSIEVVLPPDTTASIVVDMKSNAEFDPTEN